MTLVRHLVQFARFRIGSTNEVQPSRTNSEHRVLHKITSNDIIAEDGR